MYIYVYICIYMYKYLNTHTQTDRQTDTHICRHARACKSSLTCLALPVFLFITVFSRTTVGILFQ